MEFLHMLGRIHWLGWLAIAIGIGGIIFNVWLNIKDAELIAKMTPEERKAWYKKLEENRRNRTVD